MHERAGDGRPLLLAAAELMNEMCRTIGEADQSDEFRRPFFAFVRRQTLQEQWETDVFEHVHRRQEIEELKDKSDPPAPVLRQSGIIGRVQGKTLNHNFARGRILKAGQKMNERTFAAAARPAHRDKFIPRDFQRDAVERVHRPVARLIMARDIPQRDQGSFIRHGRSRRK